MQRSKNIFLMLALLGTSISFGQDLGKHEGKDRVFIIASKKAEEINRQTKILQKDKDGLKKRKLKIYNVLPIKYSEGLENQNWINDQLFYEKVKRKKNDFEVILIGLVGGVKLKQTEMISLKKLFTLIDGMPMRRSEIKN